MITYGILSASAVFYAATLWGASEPFATSLRILTCALVQIGLLVSAPVYERTRPGWSPGQYTGEFLCWPRLWVVLASAAGGLVMTLLPFSDGQRPTVCSAAGARPEPCGAFGFGYPIAYRFAYNNLGPRGIVIAAFTMDLALWGLAFLLVLYLLQLSRSREISDPGSWSAAQPASVRF